jgi:hypothetical protein
MGHVLYVGFATHRRATEKIRLYFKKFMFMQKICIKKKKIVSHKNTSNTQTNGVMNEALPISGFLHFSRKNC